MHIKRKRKKTHKTWDTRHIFGCNNNTARLTYTVSQSISIKMDGERRLSLTDLNWLLLKSLCPDAIIRALCVFENNLDVSTK